MPGHGGLLDEGSERGQSANERTNRDELEALTTGLPESPDQSEVDSAGVFREAGRRRSPRSGRLRDHQDRDHGSQRPRRAARSPRRGRRTAVLGDEVDSDEEAVLADSPTVRVRTFSFMGGNDVRHPKPSEHDR